MDSLHDFSLSRNFLHMLEKKCVKKCSRSALIVDDCGLQTFQTQFTSGSGNFVGFRADSWFCSHGRYDIEING